MSIRPWKHAVRAVFDWYSKGGRHLARILVHPALSTLGLEVGASELARMTGAIQAQGGQGQSLAPSSADGSFTWPDFARLVQRLNARRWGSGLPLAVEQRLRHALQEQSVRGLPLHSKLLVSQSHPPRRPRQHRRRRSHSRHSSSASSSPASSDDERSSRRALDREWDVLATHRYQTDPTTITRAALAAALLSCLLAAGCTVSEALAISCFAPGQSCGSSTRDQRDMLQSVQAVASKLDVPTHHTARAAALQVISTLARTPADCLPETRHPSDADAVAQWRGELVDVERFIGFVRVAASGHWVGDCDESTFRRGIRKLATGLIRVPGGEEGIHQRLTHAPDTPYIVSAGVVGVLPGRQAGAQVEGLQGGGSIKVKHGAAAHFERALAGLPQSSALSTLASFGQHSSQRLSSALRPGLEADPGHHLEVGAGRLTGWTTGRGRKDDEAGRLGGSAAYARPPDGIGPAVAGWRRQGLGVDGLGLALRYNSYLPGAGIVPGGCFGEDMEVPPHAPRPIGDDTVAPNGLRSTQVRPNITEAAIKLIQARGIPSPIDDNRDRVRGRQVRIALVEVLPPRHEGRTGGKPGQPGAVGGPGGQPASNGVTFAADQRTTSGHRLRVIANQVVAPASWRREEEDVWTFKPDKLLKRKAKSGSTVAQKQALLTQTEALTATMTPSVVPGNAPADDTRALQAHLNSVEAAAQGTQLGGSSPTHQLPPRAGTKKRPLTAEERNRLAKRELSTTYLATNEFGVSRRTLPGTTSGPGQLDTNRSTAQPPVPLKRSHTLATANSMEGAATETVPVNARADKVSQKLRFPGSTHKFVMRTDQPRAQYDTAVAPPGATDQGAAQDSRSRVYLLMELTILRLVEPESPPDVTQPTVLPSEQPADGQQGDAEAGRRSRRNTPAVGPAALCEVTVAWGLVPVLDLAGSGAATITVPLRGGHPGAEFSIEDPVILQRRTGWRKLAQCT